METIKFEKALLWWNSLDEIQKEDLKNEYTTKMNLRSFLDEDIFGIWLSKYQPDPVDKSETTTP